MLFTILADGIMMQVRFIDMNGVQNHLSIRLWGRERGRRRDGW